MAWGEVQEDTDKPIEDRIWEALKQCYDPEIPINIVDLGLVYSLSINECGGWEGGYNVEIVFTPPWDRSMMSEEAMLELGFL